jgi:nucleotide-binding universal stress UspA family protein
MLADIVVHVDSTDAGRERIAFALDLADRQGARLTGVHVIPPLDVPPYYKPHAIERATENLERFHRQDAAGAEALFAELTAGRRTPTDWQMLDGPMSARICGVAAHADLVILGQYEADGSPERHPLYLAEEVVLHGGRPVLVTPDAILRPDGSFDSVLIGWDGSAQAARAVHDALPLLIGSNARVEVLSLAERASVSPSDLAEHLRRYGLAVEINPQVRTRQSHGAELVEHMNRFDLMIMGGYGRPSWIDFLLGGTTPTVLTRAPVPVLISH